MIPGPLPPLYPLRLGLDAVAVHEKDVLPTFEEREMAVLCPLHSVNEVGLKRISGVGLTLIQRVSGSPGHPLAVAVMVYLTESII
jgi:hypothetical protein